MDADLGRTHDSMRGYGSAAATILGIGTQWERNLCAVSCGGRFVEHSFKVFDKLRPYKDPFVIAIAIGKTNCQH